MMISKQSALAVVGVVCLSACAAASYRLPLSGAEAPRYFQPIGVCATEAGLSSVQHPSSVNVQYNDSIWIQFMVHEAAYDMVIVGDDPGLEAKKKGDEIFACAKLKGPGEMPAAAPEQKPLVAPVQQQSTPEVEQAETPATKPATSSDGGAMACNYDSQCPKNNCSKGFCRTNEIAAQCTYDAHCNSNNCTNGVCQANTPGAACVYDAHCNSNNCTNATCQTNDRGAACKVDAHCNSNNCTNGKCQ